jgi:hypothetical protein
LLILNAIYVGCELLVSNGVSSSAKRLSYQIEIRSFGCIEELLGEFKYRVHYFSFGVEMKNSEMDDLIRELSAWIDKLDGKGHAWRELQKRLIDAREEAARLASG